MQGIVLTQTDNLSTFLADIRNNHIPLLKIVSGWGWHWDAASIAQTCQTMPNLMVRTVSGDGCRPPPPGQAVIFLDPPTVLSELSPWLSYRPDLLCELGNEPNMYDPSDDAAWVFRYWCLETVAAVRAAFPLARLIAPGLTSNRQFEWWDICQDAFRACAMIGFHSYAHYNADDTGDLGRAFDQLPRFFPEHPWVLTEYGIHDPATAPEVKATRYSAIHAQLPSQVHAACWYHYAEPPYLDADQQAYALPAYALPYLESEDTPMGIPINTTKYVSPNYDDRPAGTTISAIVVHTTEGAFDGDAAWLCNPSSGVSTHYVISPDGTIYQLVDPSNRAWHAGESSYAGKSYYNNFSIGIEISHQQGHGFSSGQLPSITDLCRQLLRTYPAITRTYVVMHRDVAPDRKIDPTDVSDSAFSAWADNLFIPASADYCFQFSQAVFTDRRADAPLALAEDGAVAVFGAGAVVQIGNITNGYGWVNTGIGFVPMSVIAPV